MINIGDRGGIIKMTVKELIEKLADYDPEMMVVMNCYDEWHYDTSFLMLRKIDKGLEIEDDSDSDFSECVVICTN